MDYLGPYKSTINNLISLQEKELLEKEIKKNEYAFLENTISMLEYRENFFEKIEYSLYDILPVIHSEKTEEINKLKKVKIIDLLNKIKSCEKNDNIYKIKDNLEKEIETYVKVDNRYNLFFNKKNKTFIFYTKINVSKVRNKDLGLIEGNIKIKDHNNQELGSKVFYHNFNYFQGITDYLIEVPIDIKYLNLDIKNIKPQNLHLSVNTSIDISYVNINGKNVYYNERDSYNHQEICLK